MTKKKAPEPKPLNAKHARFVAEYLVDLNATQAAIRAGYSKKTAEQQGSRLLRNAQIVAEVEAGKAKRAKRVEISQDEVLREIIRLARSDLRQLFDDRGNLLPPDKWSDEAAAAVASVEVVQRRGSEGVDTVRVRVYDKTANLTLLARHLGMLKDKVEHSGTITAIGVNPKNLSDAELEEALMAGRKLQALLKVGG